jgi:hypothetical protein
MDFAGRSIALAAFVAMQAAAGEEFVWQYSGHIIGRLTVPAGFAVETYNYREGIVTTLRYADGASVVLQSGGMYRVPMFQDPDHKLTSSTELVAKTVRVGQMAGSTLCWREDNFNPQKVTGKSVSLLALFPPNVGYARVPQARRAEFDHALDSFVREIARTPDQDAQRIRFAALVSKTEPAYPIAAKEKGIQGAVWLDAVIGKDGHVARAHSISGNPVLVDAAKDAVMQWVYKPTLLNGEPIDVILKVCVPFIPPHAKQTPSPCAPRRSRADWRERALSGRRGQAFQATLSLS